MKVRVVITVEVDPDAWEETYGTDRRDLRRDVRDHVLNDIAESAAAYEGAIISVNVA
jgi:hypothetical protein